MSTTDDAKSATPTAPRSPGLRKKNQKRGVSFTLMVAGSSGSGKTTFINTLCNTQVLPARKLPAGHEPKTTAVEMTTVEIEEDGTKIALSIVDTPGFGDNINNELGFQEILKYIEYQYDEILAQESRIKRNPKFQDNRVHVCLYFICPSGHSLREIDIDFMRRLSPRVNVLPVICKADSFTKSEIQGFKRRIMDDLRFFKIPIYDFPVDPEEDVEELIEENKELRSMLPFAVIGSDGEINDGGLNDINLGRVIRGRKYDWGVVEVDNPDHCDFSRLRFALLNSHLKDLKEITHDILYEQYRTERLSTEIKSGDSVLYVPKPGGVSMSESQLSVTASLDK